MPSTWTTSLPSGSTKIRLTPNILQDRWINIEGGEVPGDKWQYVAQAGDPTSISGSGIVYTKAGGGGVTELFYEDDDAPVNVVRLTRRGGVGYFGQSLYGDSVTMKPGATEIVNTQEAFCCAFGYFSSQAVNGVYAPDAGSYNMTSYQRVGTGKYVVTMAFTSTGTGLTYVPNVSVRKISSSQMWTAFIQQQNTTTFRIHIFETTGIGAGLGNSEVDFSDADFCVSVFGAFT